jgi:nitric oxide reductase NorQ protein
MKPQQAIRAAMIEPLSDEPDVKQALLRVADITLG